MRTKMVAALVDDNVRICQIKSVCGPSLNLEVLEAREFVKYSERYAPVPKILKATGHTLDRFESECVKVVMFEEKGCLINYCEELQRVEKLLSNVKPSKKRKFNAKPINFKKPLETKSLSPPVKRRCVVKEPVSPKLRVYNPSPIKNHDGVKKRHNEMLCEQYNAMVSYYKVSSTKSCALILDSAQLTTQTFLVTQCKFKPSRVLIPNKFEHAEIQPQKKKGLYNCSLGDLLKSGDLDVKPLSFMWFDYMNSLDGNALEKGESSPRQDMELFFSKYATPYTLFAVTLCLRHSKYSTHDYSGGTEVVVMRFVNDLAREAGLYFSIVPPTGSYGSNMFLYAGVLLPL